MFQLEDTTASTSTFVEVKRTFSPSLEVRMDPNSLFRVSRSELTVELLI